MQATFDYEKMYGQVEDFAKRYAAAKPHPHIGLDGMADDKVLRQAVAEFPPVEDVRWFNIPAKEGQLSLKQAIWELRKVPDTLARILMEINAGPFTEFLEKLTGISPLVSDPHLYGGGLHQIQRGGSLGFHADHNINPRVELYRRVSVILYLNDGWKEEYGGQLEMWSADMTHCVDTITPVLGRLAIFSNSETSFHGHPDALQRPEGMTRKSIAAYFDSIKPDPSYSTEQHRALFQERRIS